MQRYECDQCGACCKGTLIIKADDLVVLREPRLIDADTHHRGKSVPQMVYEIQHDFKAVYLACGSPCAFLNPDNRCSIYPTRPNCCVGMEAGDEQCQAARGMEGLMPLVPVDVCDRVSQQVSRLCSSGTQARLSLCSSTNEWVTPFPKSTIIKATNGSCEDVALGVRQDRSTIDCSS